MKLTASEIHRAHNVIGAMLGSTVEIELTRDSHPSKTYDTGGITEYAMDVNTLSVHVKAHDGDLWKLSIYNDDFNSDQILTDFISLHDLDPDVQPRTTLRAAILALVAKYWDLRMAPGATV